MISSHPTPLQGLNSDLRPAQIVYLATDDRRLYGEVIEVIEARQLVWMRPLLLAQFAEPNQPDITRATTVYALQEDSHLLWPWDWFQLALDTEVLSVLPYLTPTVSPRLTPKAAQEFRRFIHQVWQDNELSH
jgi:hypothetical protein